MERYGGWRRRVSIAFYVLAIVTFLVSFERLVFDVFGQMWGTMLLNAMSTVSLLGGVLSVCAAEKLAIALYAVWSVLAVGLNLIIIFVYNDIGLLSQKEHYLGLMVGNDNWWRTHGIGCTSVAVTGSGAGSGAGGGEQGAEPEDTCLASYTLIETVHASLFMFLTVVTFILSLLLLCSREKKDKFYREDEEDFRYLSIGQWHGNSQTRHHGNRSRRASASSHSKILI